MKDQSKMKKLEWSIRSQLCPYGTYLLPWKPEFWSDLAQYLMQPILHPNTAPDGIWVQSAGWSQRYHVWKCRESKQYSFILDAQDNSYLCKWWSGVAENQTHSSLYGCPCYLQELEKIHSKMKGLEWSEQIFHNRSLSHLGYHSDHNQSLLSH